MSKKLYILLSKFNPASEPRPDSYGWQHVAITDNWYDAEKLSGGYDFNVGDTKFAWGTVTRQSEYDEPMEVLIKDPITKAPIKLWHNQQIEGNEAWCPEEYFREHNDMYLIESFL